MIKLKDMKILVACEESQAVTKELRNLGHEAFSCDLLPCSGGHPEWHYQQDVFEVINQGWDMMIAHPPCTYMSKAGARWMYPTAGNLNQERFELAIEAKDMFMKLLNAPIKHIAVENPVPLKVVGLPKHSQAVQPYEYGHEYSKKTLLWLKNLPLLKPTDIVENYKPYLPSNTGGKKRGQSYSRGTAKNAKESSKTFEGIARAMAEQWTL
jgi:site-specific DNA-cytosine methylase